MIAFPDTSFLCAVYVAQGNSLPAIAQYQRLTEPLQVTALLLYEFRQSARFQTYLHAQDPRKGYAAAVAAKALADLQANIASGGVVIVPADWADVLAKAEHLSAQYAASDGQRSFDLLHVATALHLGAREFLTFDARQTALAKAEELKVNP